MKNINTPSFWDVQFKEEYDGLVNGAPHYSRWRPKHFYAVAQEIDNPKSYMVDVGCGLGHLTRFLGARFPVADVVGTDFSEFAVASTIEFGSDAFVSNCYGFETFLRDKVDYVIGMEIIEHIDHPKKFLKQCHKALKSKGKVIITTPVHGRSEAAHDHVKEYSMEELHGLMEKYFENVRIIDYGEFQLATGYKK